MEQPFRELFDVQSIKLNLDGKTKEAVFTELIDSIAHLHSRCDRAEMLALILDREEKMNTGIGNGVAIPRIHCNGIGHIAGAIGISRQGIDYGAPDNKPVNVVFLLAIDERIKDDHLRVVNQIFRLAQSEALTKIKNAQNEQHIHDFLPHKC